MCQLLGATVMIETSSGTVAGWDRICSGTEIFNSTWQRGGNQVDRPVPPESRDIPLNIQTLYSCTENSFLL
jgi:hypothetical protein